jgi:hypothetical protein
MPDRNDFAACEMLEPPTLATIVRGFPLRAPIYPLEYTSK